MSADARAVALVTGASRGLGRGIALALAADGLDVAINYAGNRAAAEECAALCAAAAPDPAQRFEPIQADVSAAADRATLLATVLERFGRIDALINNAGVAPTERADLLDASEESFQRLMRINLQGPYFLTQAVARHWLLDAADQSRLSQGYTVVMVGSISAHTASIKRGDYCISKAGMSMATQLWATRLAPEGICVYEVRPGIMRTDMTSVVTAKYDALIDEGLVPQGRWGTPADLGSACAALVGGSFPFSTGAVIDVDGGLQMRRL